MRCRIFPRSHSMDRMVSQVLLSVIHHATHLGKRTLALAIPATIVAKQQQQQAVASYCCIHLFSWHCPFISLMIWGLLSFTLLKSDHHLSSFNTVSFRFPSHPDHNEVQKYSVVQTKSACACVCVCLSEWILKTLASMFCYFGFQDTPSATKSSKSVRATRSVFGVGLMSFPK